MTIRAYNDPEPYEWEDAPTGCCAGCSIVRPLKAGICRQCTRERAEAPAPRIVEYQEASLW